MGMLFAGLASAKGYSVVVHDTGRQALERAAAKGYYAAKSLSELVALSDYVLVATPPRVARRVIGALSSMEVEGRVVFDIATFKKDIVEAYKQLPRGAKAASAHPLFGPGARRPEAHTVAVVPLPGREDDAMYVEEFMRGLGFHVVRIDVEAHDRIMGIVVGGSYTVAALVAALLASYNNPGEVLELAGTTFKHLLVHLKSILNDPQGFIEYILSNKETKRAARTMHRALGGILADPEKGVELLEWARTLWSPREIGEAYKKLYRLVEDEY
jgi:prephenate dehydrogenase